MRAARYQTTLSGPCRVSGRGYWSGEVNTLTFLPAPAGTGIRFVRTDLSGNPSVLATTEYRLSMPLRPQLRDGACEVDMVEHVMAALYGMQIDNVFVHCTAREMPGLDGSSLAYVLALDEIGQVELRSKRRILRITQPLRVGDGQKWIQIEPTHGDLTEVEYRLDYGANSPIGTATYSAQVDTDTFYNCIAPARTFISQADAKALQKKGLAAHVTERDLLVFGKHGPLNNQLRFRDECARHKALDLIGDLALAGVDLVGRVTACQSGHQLNGQMVQQLYNLMNQCEPRSKAA